jgi:hypothetical protein
MIPSNDDPHGYRYFEGGFPDSWRGAGFNTGFRVWIRWAVLAAREDLSDALRFRLGVKLCYAAIPEGARPETLAEGIQWFAGCGESDRIGLLGLPPRFWDDVGAMRAAEAGKPRMFDYFWDFKALWASFMGAYGIDLYKADLHWWGFQGLLSGLPGETALGKLLETRGKRITNNMSRDEYLPFKLAALPDRY